MKAMRVFGVVLATMIAASAARGADDRPAVRSALLASINQSRAAAGLHPLALDPAASAAADERAREMIREGTTGHFGLDGLPPYARYSFAGIDDWSLENAASWSSNLPYHRDSLLPLALRSHQAMMAERPPSDSHRRALLDPHATHAGIGFDWRNGEFRMVEIILRRVARLETKPLSSSIPGTPLELSGAFVPSVQLDRVSLHIEPLETALTRAAANAREAYALSPPVRAVRPGENESASTLAAWAARRRGGAASVESRKGSRFAFRAVPDAPGLYTFVVWARPKSGGPRFAAASVSVRVEAPSPSAMPSVAGR